MYSQKIASCINLQPPIEIFKNRLFQTCVIVKRTCITIFSKIGSVDQSKPCTQIDLHFFLICINLQLTIRISKHHAFRTCTAHSRSFRPILRSISLLDSKIPRKEIISTADRRTDRQTDRQTDRRTDRRRVRQQNVLFLKKEKTTKNEYFYIFFYKILAKYSNCIIFKNVLMEVCPRTPLANAWLCHALHGASRHANTTHYPKIF